MKKSAKRVLTVGAEMHIFHLVAETHNGNETDNRLSQQDGTKKLTQ